MGKALTIQDFCNLQMKKTPVIWRNRYFRRMKKRIQQFQLVAQAMRTITETCFPRRAPCFLLTAIRIDTCHFSQQNLHGVKIPLSIRSALGLQEQKVCRERLLQRGLWTSRLLVRIQRDPTCKPPHRLHNPCCLANGWKCTYFYLLQRRVSPTLLTKDSQVRTCQNIQGSLTPIVGYCEIAHWICDLLLILQKE